MRRECVLEGGSESEGASKRECNVERETVRKTEI